MTVIRDVSVDNVGSETFDRIVEFVFQQVTSYICQCVMGPVCMLASLSLEVLNYHETVLKCLGIQKWIKSISTGA